MKLAIRIKHNPNATRVDRREWLKVMKYILNDSRVQIYNDSAGDPYQSICGLYRDAAKESPTHLLVLEDDVLPCFNFIPTVEKIINVLKNDPVTFFTNSKAVDVALNEDINWIRLKIWYYTQSYVMPFRMMGNMLSWIDENVVDDDRHSDDERMAMYFYFHNQFVYATAPSLVEHIGWNSSSLKHDRPEEYMNSRDLRTARKFIGIDINPSNIDWVSSLKNAVFDYVDCGLEDYKILFQRLLKPSSKYKKVLKEEIKLSPSLREKMVKMGLLS